MISFLGIKISQKKQKFLMGFTLIEILVVIAIIGLLAGTIIVYVESARVKTRDAARKEDLRQIQHGLIQYYNDYDKYPADLSDLVPEYLKNVPSDLKTKNPYVYKASDDGNRYEIDAILELNHDKAADIDGGNQSFPVYEVGSDLTLI